MANTYTLISNQTVGAGGSSNITFSNIPQTYTDLVFNYSLRASATDSADAFDMIMTTSIGSTLITNSLRGDGTGTNYNAITDRLLRQIVPSNWTASYFSNGQLYFPSYSSSNNKSFMLQASVMQNSSSQATIVLGGAQNSTTAISSVVFTVNNSSNFVQYSSIALYGISNS